MIKAAVLASLGQLGDARFRRVLILGAGTAAAILGAITMTMVWAVLLVVPPDATVPGLGDAGWLGGMLSWATAAIFVTLSVFLILPVTGAIMPFFLDRIADAVEEKHYSALPPAPRSSLGESLRDAINFWGVLIAANVAALVFYLIFAPAALFIFWGLNGYLLGREYFMLAALRRMSRGDARALRARHSGSIWITGVLIAVPLSVPVLNLLVPILGVASLTHLFHMSQGRRPSG